MKQIIQASNYRIKKGKEFYYSYILVILLTVAFLLTGILQENRSESLGGVIDNITFFFILVNMFFISVCIGNDFRTKVLYYEVMCGHSRAEVFFGRMISTLIHSIIIGFTQILLFIIFIFSFNLIPTEQ